MLAWNVYVNMVSMVIQLNRVNVSVITVLRYLFKIPTIHYTYTA